jgi:beta-lactamase regulating signal transducer with metallopeptidase domain
MHDLIDFFAQCARSGTLLTSLCAIVLLPIGAWFACRFVAPIIAGMKDDAAWQAPLAATAAALPGALFVVLWVGAIFSGLGSACLSLPVGRLVFGVIIAAMIAALARATVLALARSLGIRRLIRSSSPPSPRLRAHARASDMHARELHDSAPICALAGTLSPVVLVSTGALSAISDEELCAALQHERAHARRGDQLLAAALAFLVDLLPLPVADLVQTYRTAREFAADQDAVRATNADSLAGALIEFAKGGRATAGAACLIDDRASTTTQRLRALLTTSPRGPHQNRLRRFALAVTLAAIAVGGVATPSLAGAHAAPCDFVMKADR